jgi:hypothetical protein
MIPKRFCQISIGLTIVGLAVVGAINLVVDPFGAYPNADSKKFERFRATIATRVARAELARTGKWDMAILGTSRPQTGLPAGHPAFKTNHVCNLSVTGPRMEEIAAIFEYARAHNHLRRVLLCLDLTLSRPGGDGETDFSESRFNPRLSLFQYHCKNLFGSDARDYSWTFARREFASDFPSDAERDGFQVRTLAAGLEQRALFERVLRSLAHTYAANRIPAEEWAALRRVLRACHQNNIELTLAINPVHALDLELLRAAGGWDRFEQWKRDLVKLVAEESPEGRVILWDFAGYWPPATEQVPPAKDCNTRMRFYFENSHYTTALGALMLDRMYGLATDDFGERISTANIDAHLAIIRQQRDSYVKACAVDVEWTQNIGRQALVARKYILSASAGGTAKIGN